MAVVWIPGLLRDLTGGQQTVDVPGKTVRDVIAAMEERFPGMQDRLIEDGRLMPSIIVVVDGEPGNMRLRQPLREDSEVHFLPAISGGI